MLDLGCGEKPYRDLITAQHYVGVDVLVSGHASANKRADVYYDGAALPFSSCCFDSALCSEVLEHVFTIEKLLSEVRRVLKPGAAFLITIPFCWDQHEVPYDFARYTEWGIRHLLETHGFSVVAQEKTSTYIETLTQLAAAYLYKHFDGKVVAAFLRIPIAAAFLVGVTLNKILPNNGHLYLNQIILARRL